MGKYEPLSARLARETADEWTARFAELERVLGFPLPRSARTYREWWANQRDSGHSQARGWQDAGWQVWKVDLKREEVTFRRRSPAAPEQDPVDEALFRRAAAYLGTDDRGSLIREALAALCQREAARRLARLGGSMPGIEAPPRRRFG